VVSFELLSSLARVSNDGRGTSRPDSRPRVHRRCLSAGRRREYEILVLLGSPELLSLLSKDKQRQAFPDLAATELPAAVVGEGDHTHRRCFVAVLEISLCLPNLIELLAEE